MVVSKWANKNSDISKHKQTNKVRNRFLGDQKKGKLNTTRGGNVSQRSVSKKMLVGCCWDAWRGLTISPVSVRDRLLTPLLGAAIASSTSTSLRAFWSTRVSVTLLFGLRFSLFDESTQSVASFSAGIRS